MFGGNGGDQEHGKRGGQLLLLLLKVKAVANAWAKVVAKTKAKTNGDLRAAKANGKAAAVVADAAVMADVAVMADAAVATAADAAMVKLPFDYI